MFHNVCSHRGYKLLQKECSLKNVIRCPYHSWSYDFLGNLVATPHIGGMNKNENEKFDRSKNGLKEIRILGKVTQVTDKEADIYFSSRPYESRIGAWASDQSNVMKEKEELLKKIEDFKKNHKDKKNFPRPKYWSGWCLNPSSIEFWLGDQYRIHERLRYTKILNDWKKSTITHCKKKK